MKTKKQIQERIKDYKRGRGLLISQQVIVDSWIRELEWVLENDKKD